MATGHSSYRQLNFENDNGELREDDHDMVINFNENQIVTLKNSEDSQFEFGIEELDKVAPYMTSSFNENEGFNFKSLSNDEDCPKIGLEFDTEEDAYQFYLAYAKRVGFSIRRSKSHNDKFGKARLQTRFHCHAKIKVSARRRIGGKFCVIQFVEEHNHYLSTPSKTHLHRSHMKITSSAALQIQMANDVGIPPKSSHALMARQMRTDYSHFGDVVSFDTTYRKNNEGRPIALFVGVNHHKQTVIFGAALLYDETFLTFEWLFDTFTIAMREKKPTTILTDQDAAMAKALASTWPETHHRLCIWHIYQNAAIHLSGVFSQFKDFAKDFGACVYDFEEEEEFIDAWNKMLSKYALADNTWLRRLFGLKEKWALVYGRQIFCAYMTTTQRSESMNSSLKKYVSYQHKFLEFFNHFQRLIEDRRYDEIRADFKSNITIPYLIYPVEILKHVASVYTPEVYKWFLQEWYKSHDSSLECLDDGEVIAKYKITLHRKSNHHTVTFDSTSEKFYCSCKKFDFAGILSSHILKVFTLKNIMKIPSESILKRWTRQAKVGLFGVSESNFVTHLDPKILQNMRYKELCGLYVQLATKAAESEDTYKMIKAGFLKMSEMVDERLQSGKLNIQQPEIRLPFEEFDQHIGELQTHDTSTRGAKGI
ncbi:hypothetical protein C2S52_019735 [Perilla frutescens var. hirtella]|nr:hypothetical protein C2S52_019735 [Perilla frutescens var. hirtella]